MPLALAFHQAVTLPVVRITAHYCVGQAKLRSLHAGCIHAASGGVGLASVELFATVHANTCATAGGITKHALLRTYKVERLSSSRDAAACAALLSMLERGRRLHCLLNALSNDFASLSLGLLASRGSLQEIGKNSIWSHGRSLAARPRVDYVAVAVDDGCRGCSGWNADPLWFNTGLCQLSACVRAGEVQPLPMNVVGFEEDAVRTALRLLQRGANIGKMVVHVGQQWLGRKEMQAQKMTIQSSYRDRRERGTLVRACIVPDPGTATLELHDPMRFNTMGSALGDDMRCAADHLHERRHAIHAVTLQGAGSTFCAGSHGNRSAAHTPHTRSCMHSRTHGRSASLT